MDLLTLIKNFPFSLAAINSKGEIQGVNSSWEAQSAFIPLVSAVKGIFFPDLFHDTKIHAEILKVIEGQNNSFAGKLNTAQNSGAIIYFWRLEPAATGVSFLATLSIEKFCHELEEKFNLLRTLLDTMPDIVCFKDGEGRWLEANKSDMKLFELTNVNYYGKKDSELAEYSPHFYEAFMGCEDSDEKAWNGGKISRSEEVIQLRNGLTTVLDLYKIPLFTEDGKRKGLVVLGRDITQIKEQQTKLKILHQQQNIIQSLLLLSLKDSSLGELLEKALDIIMQVSWLPPATMGAIFLVERINRKKLYIAASKNISSDIFTKCKKVQFGSCLCGTAAHERQFIFASDSKDNLHTVRHDLTDTHSHYISPIIFEKKPVGVLMLCSEHQKACLVEEKFFFENVSNTLAQLIMRKISDEKLTKSEMNLAKAQEIAQLGHWTWDINTNKLQWSDTVFDIFGISKDNNGLKFETFFQYVHPEDRERVQNVVDRAIEKQNHFKIRHRILLEDGSVRFVHAEAVLKRNIDNKLQMFGTVQDITERLQIKNQLQLANKVFESSIEGITVTDASGQITFVNSAFTQITGYSPDEVLGKSPNILKSDKHDKRFYYSMWNQLKHKGQWQGEVWNRRKNGEIYLQTMTITAVNNELGETESYVAVFHDISEVIAYRDKLHFQAYHDALTGLPNRNLMLDRLKIAINHAKQKNTRVAVVLIDLDNFKHVNDSLGHNIGDRLLKEAGTRIQKCVQQDVTVARLGGDDFTLFLEDVLSETEVVDTAEKILEAFSIPFNLTVYESFVTVSMGIAFFPEDGETPNILLKNAELAMYRSKEEGKNKFQLFRNDMNTSVVRRLQLENDMRKALEKDEFVVFYQPKIALATGKIVGMEALVRWEKDNGVIVPPFEFIPLAEETGLIIPIGEIVFKKAAIKAKQWRAMLPNISMAVNISIKQFQSKNFINLLHETLEEIELSPEIIELEITESIVMGDEKKTISLLNQIQDMNMKIAIDDFGTGYSSLQYLRKLPIDTLKIDRSFVVDIPYDRDSVAIASTILNLAANMDFNVVAEGVENFKQFCFFRKSLCQQMQGYLFSPPVAETEMEALIKKKEGVIIPGDCNKKN